MEMVLGVLGGLLTLSTLVFAIACVVWTERSNKQAKARAALSLTDEAPREETFDAAVVNMQCRLVTTGGRVPQTVKEYLVFFQREDGTVCRYPVSEEFYQGFEIGQRGCATLIDGAIYAFSLEEDIECETE